VGRADPYPEEGGREGLEHPPPPKLTTAEMRFPDVLGAGWSGSPPPKPDTLSRIVVWS